MSSTKETNVKLAQASEILDRCKDSLKAKSFAELGRALDIPQSAITRALRVGHVPDVWLYKVAYKTGRSVDWLRSGTGASPALLVAEAPLPYHAAPMHRVPLLTWIQAGLFTDRTSPPHPGEADDYVWTDVRGARVFALRVKGDSMEPVFHEGEIVLVNPDFECRPDDYVIVKRPDHGSEDATLKQLKKIGAQYFLHPLNPKHPDVPLTKRHRIVGKVVRKQLDF